MARSCAPITWKARQEDCCEFKGNLGYVVNFKPVWSRVRSCLKDFLFLEAWVPVCNAPTAKASAAGVACVFGRGHRALPSTFLLSFLHQACFLSGPALNSVQTTFFFYVRKATISFFFFPNRFQPTRNSCENSIRSHASGRSVSLSQCTCSLVHTTNAFARGKNMFSLCKTAIFRQHIEGKRDDFTFPSPGKPHQDVVFLCFLWRGDIF